jgi:O-antigen ligase
MATGAALDLWNARRRLAWPREPLVYTALLGCLAVVASSAKSVTPGLVPLETVIEGAGDLLKPWLFLLVAWSIRDQQARLPLLLGLALLGFVFGAVRALDETSLAALIDFQRPSFRWSINAFAQYAAAGLLGLIVLAPRTWMSLRESRWQAVAVTVWLALLVLLSAALLFAQSRTALIGLSIVAFGVVVHAGRLDPPGGGPRPPIPGPIVAALLAGGALALAGTLGRFDFPSWHETDAWLSTGDNPLGDGPIEIRLTLWRLGLDLWFERPWLGWGPGTSSLLVADASSGIPTIAGMPDFHNLVVDLLVSIGLIGTAAYVLGFVLVVHAARKAYSTGCLARDLYLLLFWLLVFELLSQMTSYRIDSYHGRFFWMLVAGAACCCRFGGASETAATDRRHE